MIKKIIFVLILLLSESLYAQENYKTPTKNENQKIYLGGKSYEVTNYIQPTESQKPRNVILMIGDGMGFSQVSAGHTANHGKLFLDNFKYTGLVKTHSSDNYITDSAAGGTALSSGIKTNNGKIGKSTDLKHAKTILEMAEEKGLSTGLVSTSSITHATPASFIAHNASRMNYEEIATDFLKTDIDVFIGGGYKHFANRLDKRNLIEELNKKGYKVLRNMNEISRQSEGKLAGLTADEHNAPYPLRAMSLPLSTRTALNILSKNDKGFFIMIEGSQIDWGGHQNDTSYIVNEMLDFDRSIGKALEFASKDNQTLIVVTADHETGGFSIIDGNTKTGMVKGHFTTDHHTGVMVPVFAYGAGAENFTGILDNTEIAKKIISLLDLDSQR